MVTARWLERRGIRLLARVLVLAVGALVPVAVFSRPARALAPTPIFAPYVNYNVGIGRAVAVGDFTGDGRNDVVLTTRDPQGKGDDRLWLFVQGGDGRFARTESWPISLGYLPQAGVAAGDLDGDGKTDVVVATGHGLAVFLQRSGTLSPLPLVPLEGAQQVRVADVDGDGHADVVTNGTGVTVLYGTGGGAFSTPAVVTTTAPIEVEVGDVTGDHRPDVVTCDNANMFVYTQGANRSFGDPASYSGDIGCGGLAVGDLDGDGRLDVAVAGGGNTPTARVDVFSQRSDGTLAPASTYSTYDLPGPTTVGDMNGDGRTDLVVVHRAFMAVGVHAQAPDHSLDPERRFTIPYADSPQPESVDVGDVNGDGHADIVLADAQHGLVVLAGQAAGPSTTTSTSVLPPPTTVPAGSTPSLLTGGDTYSVGSAPESVAIGDFNGDGRADVAMSTTFNADPYNDYKLFVFLQGATGSFDRVVRFDTDGDNNDVRPQVMALAAGDLDGDGKTDLVLRTVGGVDVFMQRNGTFADRKYIEMPVAATMEIADLDRDGKGDLVMAGDDGIRVYRSLGALTFAAPEQVTTDYHRQLAIGDVTGDGRLDLVATNAYAGQSAVVVYPQSPDGSFAGPTSYPTGGYASGAVTVGDLTGDGRADVAVADTDGNDLYFAHVKVLAQQADGTLGPPVAYDSVQPAFLRPADVDGDGRTDLISLQESMQVGVFLQQADGTLGAEQHIAANFTTAPLTTLPVAVGDVSGDGRPDVAIADVNRGLVVMRALPPPPPPAVPQAATTSWSQGANSPLDGVAGWVYPVSEPAGAGRVQPNYLYGLTFGFADGSATGAVSLLADPTGRYALFNVVEADGTPHAAIVPFAWTAGRFYLPFVYQLAPGTWGAFVYDATAGSWTTIGSLNLPDAWGKLSPLTTTTALWYGPEAASCGAYPVADVVFSPPLGFAGATAAWGTPGATVTGAGQCQSQASLQSGWARYRLGAGA